MSSLNDIDLPSVYDVLMSNEEQNRYVVSNYNEMTEQPEGTYVSKKEIAGEAWIYENGVQTVTPDHPATECFSGVTIHTMVPQPRQEVVEDTVYDNGTYHYLPQQGSLLKRVSVTVNTSGSNITSKELTVYENGLHGFSISAPARTLWNEILLSTNIPVPNETTLSQNIIKFDNESSTVTTPESGNVYNRVNTFFRPLIIKENDLYANPLFILTSNDEGKQNKYMMFTNISNAQSYVTQELLTNKEIIIRTDISETIQFEGNMAILMFITDMNSARKIPYVIAIKNLSSSAKSFSCSTILDMAITYCRGATRTENASFVFYGVQITNMWEGGNYDRLPQIDAHYTDAFAGNMQKIMPAYYYRDIVNAPYEEYVFYSYTN